MQTIKLNYDSRTNTHQAVVVNDTGTEVYKSDSHKSVHNAIKQAQNTCKIDTRSARPTSSLKEFPTYSSELENEIRDRTLCSS